MCTGCGWLGRAGDDRGCPLCGEPLREVPDVLDEAAAAALDAGGRVLAIRPETPLRKDQVAASLRFPLPPRPDEAA